jgi:hypothetical protein
MTGQGREGLIIQSRSRGTGREAGSGSGTGRVVSRVGTGSGQARVKNQEGEEKRGWEKTGADRTNAGKLDKQDKQATDRQPFPYPHWTLLFSLHISKEGLRVSETYFISGGYFTLW